MPPRKILEIYKYIIFFIVYNIFLNPNEVTTIKNEVIIFISINTILLLPRNNANIDTPPIRAPLIIFFIFVFLLKIRATDNINIKSIKKLSNITTSMYTSI